MMLLSVSQSRCLKKNERPRNWKFSRPKFWNVCATPIYDSSKQLKKFKIYLVSAILQIWSLTPCLRDTIHRTTTWSTLTTFRMNSNQLKTHPLEIRKNRTRSNSNLKMSIWLTPTKKITISKSSKWRVRTSRNLIMIEFSKRQLKASYHLKRCSLIRPTKAWVFPKCQRQRKTYLICIWTKLVSSSINLWPRLHRLTTYLTI